MATSYKTMSGYDCRNKWVFSFRRNVASDGADWTSSGTVPESWAGSGKWAIADSDTSWRADFTKTGSGRAQATSVSRRQISDVLQLIRRVHQVRNCAWSPHFSDQHQSCATGSHWLTPSQAFKCVDGGQTSAATIERRRRAHAVDDDRTLSTTCVRRRTFECRRFRHDTGLDMAYVAVASCKTEKKIIRPKWKIDKFS